LDLKQVQQEQQALVAQLAAAIPQERLQPLIDQAKQMQTGAVSAEQFYTALKDLAASASVDVEQHPALARYIRYVTQKARLKPADLSNELDLLAARLKESLVTTPTAQRLVAIAAQRDLLQKLVELKLSPQEYERFSEELKPGMVAQWSAFFNEQFAALGLPARTFTPAEGVAGLEALDGALPKLTTFYEAAGARDEALVANALAKISETKEPLAVLITGGFHAPQLEAKLKAHGVGLVAVAPKMTEATNEQLYEAVLKYKSGHGSFEAVEAAAKHANHQ
jgi:hypothetical protein